MSAKAIGKILRGEPTTTQALRRIAAALGVTVADVVSDHPRHNVEEIAARVTAAVLQELRPKSIEGTAEALAAAVNTAETPLTTKQKKRAGFEGRARRIEMG